MLEEGSSLVLVDWLTSGRMSRGEGWDFARFESRNQVMVQVRELVAKVIITVVFQQLWFSWLRYQPCSSGKRDSNWFSRLPCSGLGCLHWSVAELMAS